jgi:hypothetical protein
VSMQVSYRSAPSNLRVAAKHLSILHR